MGRTGAGRPECLLPQGGRRVSGGKNPFPAWRAMGKGRRRRVSPLPLDELWRWTSEPNSIGGTATAPYIDFWKTNNSSCLHQPRARPHQRGRSIRRKQGEPSGFTTEATFPLGLSGTCVQRPQPLGVRGQPRTRPWPGPGYTTHLRGTVLRVWLFPSPPHPS